MTISVDGLYLNGFSPQLNVLLSRNNLFIIKKKNIMTITIIMSMVMMTSQKLLVIMYTLKVKFSKIQSVQRHGGSTIGIIKSLALS